MATVTQPTDATSFSEFSPEFQARPAGKSSSRSRRRGWIGAGVVVVLAAGTLLAIPSVRHVLSSETPAEWTFPTAAVSERPFESRLQARGTIESRRNISLASEVNGFTTILSLLPAGTTVGKPVRARTGGVVEKVEQSPQGSISVVVTDARGKAHTYESERLQPWTAAAVEPGERVVGGQILIGDVICRLDASQLIDAERQEQIYVTNTQANYEMAKKNLDIQTAKNESKLAAAKLKAELAALDLKKYVSASYPQQQEQINGQIQQFQEELTRAREAYDYSRRMSLKGYVTADEVDKNRLKVMLADTRLKQAEQGLEILNDYTHDRTLLDLRERAANAARDLHRVELSGEAAMAQLRSIAASRERVYEIYRGRLDRARKQIKACTIVAPQAGQVVYARQSSRGSSNTSIEEGARVRERQELFQLPDLTAMKVDLDIHESVISRIREGLEAEILVDALPGVVYRGRLTEVSSVPRPGQYPHYDRRFFGGVVEIEADEETLARLRPGMTAKVELVTARSVERVAQVPQQAVLSAGGRHFTWVVTEQGPQCRPVTLGHSNDECFVVTTGLAVGEQVVLQPQYHFEDEIVALLAAEEAAGAYQPGELDAPAAVRTDVALLPDVETTIDAACTNGSGTAE